MSLNDTPRANRLHIGIYGKRNAGKSSLINALTGQETALVSAEAGTTTDPVFKSMELHPVGPVVFIDTAGFDDTGELGKLRVERTQAVMDRTDVAVIVIGADSLSEDVIKGIGSSDNTGSEFAIEKSWIDDMDKKGVPIIIALNKVDCLGLSDKEPVQRESLSAAASAVGRALGEYPVIPVSATSDIGLDRLRKAVAEAAPEDYLRERILGGMISEGGLALLVMPQDIQAPKGRLILPQVQTIRELLDRKCTAVATTADGLEKTLSLLNKAPELIVTDSQCFGEVYDKKPEQSELTSFSVLFAAYKGDIEKFTEGASALDDILEKSRRKDSSIRILIAEACTHVPLEEDIGTIKIPRMLRGLLGESITVDNVRGSDFPDIDRLAEYDLIVHCGACMFNRKLVMNRIAAAEAAGVPITNYGVILAKLTGILDKIKLPQSREKQKDRA